MAEAKATAQVFDARSGRKSSLDLAGPQFETKPKEHVIHRAVVAELDSRRRYIDQGPQRDPGLRGQAV